MLWTNADKAGFCLPESTPWLPINDDYHTNNVEVSHLNCSLDLVPFKVSYIKFREVLWASYLSYSVIVQKVTGNQVLS